MFLGGPGKIERQPSRGKNRKKTDRVHILRISRSTRAAETTLKVSSGFPCLGKRPPGKEAGDRNSDSALVIDLHGDPVCEQTQLQSLLLSATSQLSHNAPVLSKTAGKPKAV